MLQFPNKIIFPSLKVLANSADPNEMPHYVASLFAKVCI